MRTKISIILSFWFFLIACSAGQPVLVQLNYNPEKQWEKAKTMGREKVNLPVAKMDIFDKREDRENLGSTDGPIYGTGGIIEWVRSGIISLSEFGYSFPPLDAKNNPSGLSFKLNILRTSCRGTIMNMRCTVLIEVEFFTNGTLIEKKTYYGTQMEAKDLMSEGMGHFGEGAVQRGLNGALEQFLGKFEADLRKLSK